MKLSFSETYDYVMKLWICRSCTKSPLPPTFGAFSVPSAPFLGLGTFSRGVPKDSFPRLH